MPLYAVPPPADALKFLRATELFGRVGDAALDEVVEALEVPVPPSKRSRNRSRVRL